MKVEECVPVTSVLCNTVLFVLAEFKSHANMMLLRSFSPHCRVSFICVNDGDVSNALFSLACGHNGGA